MEHYWMKSVCFLHTKTFVLALLLTLNLQDSRYRDDMLAACQTLLDFVSEWCVSFPTSGRIQAEGIVQSSIRHLLRSGQ